MIATSKQSKMDNSTYNLSFTAAGLLFSESLIVADEHFKANDWKAAAENIKRQNLLQSRTESAGNRILREVCARLRHLTTQQLDLLRSGTRPDQQQILWLAVCKRYELLYDFGSDVVRNKFLHLDLTIAPNDFDDFLEAKCLWHPEIEKIASSTRAKLRQVAFRMIREAGICDDDRVIQPTVLSVEIARVIQSDSESFFAIYPVSESDVKALLS